MFSAENIGITQPVLYYERLDYKPFLEPHEFNNDLQWQYGGRIFFRSVSYDTTRRTKAVVEIKKYWLDDMQREYSSDYFNQEQDYVRYARMSIFQLNEPKERVAKQTREPNYYNSIKTGVREKQ